MEGGFLYWSTAPSLKERDVSEFSRPLPAKIFVKPATCPVLPILAGVFFSLLSACGGEPQSASTTNAEAASPSAGAPDMRTAGYDRSTFILCDAIEPGHYRELADIVGFEADEWGAQFRTECIVKGARVAFARVKLQPAMAPSAEAVAKQSYDGDATPAPELGDDAWFVDDGLQPHVIFAMGPLVLDVSAESEQTPDRGTMIELALRIRDILREANG